jgi:hypothetical protein
MVLDQDLLQSTQQNLNSEFRLFHLKTSNSFQEDRSSFLFFILCLISTYEFFRVYFENFLRSARHTISLRISNLAHDFN